MARPPQDKLPYMYGKCDGFVKLNQVELEVTAWKCSDLTPFDRGASEARTT